MKSLNIYTDQREILELCALTEAAKKDGRKAYHAGESHMANPYHYRHHDYNAWHRGWEQARRREEASNEKT